MAVTPTAAISSFDPLRQIPAFLDSGTPATGTPAYVFKEGLKHQCFYLADVDNGNAWVSHIGGLVSFAFAADAFLAAEQADARLSNMNRGSITVSTTGNDASGFLHVWSRHGVNTTGGTSTVTPDAYSTINPDHEIPLNAAGGAEPGSSGQNIHKMGLTHRCFLFENVGTGETWTSGIRGIVSLATARAEASGNYSKALLTTAATGVVTFTTSSGTPDIFLHVWSHS